MRCLAALGAAQFDRVLGCRAVQLCPGCVRRRAANSVARRVAMCLWLRCVPAEWCYSRLSCTLLDLRDPRCERGYRSLLCPNAVSCQARSNEMQLLLSVRRQVSAKGCVCAACFATLVAEGIRKVNHRGSDLPKVAWRVSVSAEARPPLTPVPAIMLVAVTCRYVIHTQGQYWCRNCQVHIVA